MSKTPPPLPTQQSEDQGQQSRFTGQAMAEVPNSAHSEQVNLTLVLLASVLFVLFFLLMATAAYLSVTADARSEKQAQAGDAGDTLVPGSFGTPASSDGSSEGESSEPLPESNGDSVTKSPYQENGTLDDAPRSSSSGPLGTDTVEDPEVTPNDGSTDDALTDTESQSKADESGEDREQGTVVVDDESPPQDEEKAKDEGGATVPRMLNSGTNADEGPVDGVGAGGHVDFSEDFEKHLEALRENGLEVALLFDATSSMHAQITTVKRQLRKIVGTVHTLVPKAEFTVAVYRDFDSVPAEGITLTTDAKKIERFVKDVRLIGGGDLPESVASGLKWVSQRNAFAGSSNRVLIIVGDAPPHAREMDTCLTLIQKHFKNGESHVYTLTCNRAVVLPEFETLAKAGNGLALSLESRSIVKELLVLSLGAEYRDEIVKLIKKK